ncbi:MAG: glycosyltransferase family 4 protein [Candidatus Bathyarchaeia archaeon]
METLRIAWFNWRCIRHPEAGGAEVFTHEVARRLVSKGHEITLLTSRPEGLPKEEQFEGYKILRAGSLYTVYLKARRIYMDGLRGKVDLVIDEVNTLPFFTVKYAKEPVLSLIHQLAREYWLLELKPPISWIGYLLEPRYLSLYRRTPAITVSDSTRRDLEGLGFEKVYIVKEGLGIRPLDNIPAKEGEPTAIFLGRLKKAKGPHHAIKAFRLLSEKLADCRLWIVGDGPLRPKLLRLARKLGLEKKVVLFGRVSETQKLNLLGRAHVLVFPAVREGWGLVVTEANACGTPAVGYDVPGLRDSIRHGKTGVLVPPKDLGALAGALMKLLSDHGVRRELSRNALEWSREFSWDRSAEEFLRVVKDATGKN